MAFGMRTVTGDFLSIVKYDARSGIMTKIDKQPDGTSIPTEIPYGTKFAIDFGTLEAGWVMFGAQGPVRVMVPYYDGVQLPPQPQDKDAEGKLMFKSGFYTKICGKALDGAREWVGNAVSLLNALEELYQQYLQAPQAAAGQIPIVCIASKVAIKSGSGLRSSTNWAPVFRIEGWTDRPEMLKERTTPVPIGTAALAPPARATPASAPAPAPRAAPPPPAAEAAKVAVPADEMPF
jgi:hypothetical protein